MNELQSILNRTGIPTKRKNLLTKKYIGGLCLSCDGIPTILVTYDISDSELKAQRIERYCSNCFEKSGIGKKKLKLLDTGQRNETEAIVMHARVDKK